MHRTLTQTPEERPLSAPPPADVDAVNGQPPDQRPRHAQPRSLGEALREAGISLESSATGSETPSEEDYDENVRPAYDIKGKDEQELRKRKPGRRVSKKELLSAQVDSTIVRDGSGGIRIYPENDLALQKFLQRTSESVKYPDKAIKQKRKFRDHLFTHQFSAFDSHNSVAANSPFHGFYTLFWLAVALFVLKISVTNWRVYGTPLGSNEIMKTMFHRDVIVLLLSDGVMCGLTGVSWLIQKLVYYQVLDWDSSGWIVQNIWQTMFITGIIGWTHVRNWPWTHTVFFVLHGIIMLMKQHSYAFYNGHLSTVYSMRLFLLSKLKQLDLVHPSEKTSSAVPTVSSLSTDHLRVPPTAVERRHSLSQVPKTEETDIDKIAKAIASREPLNDEQIETFERIIKWEVDALADELRGTSSNPNKAYPNNLTFLGHYEWIPLPTLVYELEYPRSQEISWKYVAEKLVAMVGVLFVMNQVAQYSIYPVVMKTVQMKENGLPLAARFQEFPLLLLDLIFPFMMEYLLVWYLIWETILNVLAELTYFADRSFYDAWWNSVSWDQFARDWNRPVHVFLLRHVYHSSISSMKVNKHTATLITFFLSACIHELVMWCLFNKLRGYLLVLQMCQLPLVRLSRTKWLKGQKTLGNLIFWLGIFTGPSLLCSLYLIL
ncbi:acyl-CoA/sterol acyltransferase [Pochonia chlamydosporia 170]|uniref:Acyl-CoA/sterol acyltransferase n=1 Tax=Pochonia chlamydosporia 170 TaxID=1380566 RepID=A0A179FKK6_METCM|nr:acyl-CoA/sterol acyltransferase [Pochonia chlamydosporia 170]OAQ65827.1 acyl-CoA/sterol acyltransferase [Pochonia chlamydosporia 170]